MQQLGGRVCKGAKSELVIFWKLFAAGDDAEADDGDTRSRRRPPMLRYYRVFNVEQTEGLEKHLPPPPEERTFTPIETAARIVEAMPQRPPIQLPPHRKPLAALFQVQVIDRLDRPVDLAQRIQLEDPPRRATGSPS